MVSGTGGASAADGIGRSRMTGSRTHPHSISHTHELEGNVSTPKFLIDHNIIPAAIVTPDGRWHEKER